MTTGTTDWSAIAPFLVALSGFAALFQGLAKAVKPAANANWNEVFGKWIDVLASAGGGFIALAVFYFWADQMGLRLTHDQVRNLIGLMVFLALAVAGLAFNERCRLQTPKPKGDDAKKDTQRGVSSSSSAGNGQRPKKPDRYAHKQQRHGDHPDNIGVGAQWSYVS